MTDQQLVLQAASYPQPAGGGRLRTPQQKMKRILSITFASSIAVLSIVGEADAQARQQCSASAASHAYWSWRLIDGRKCWYKGKPMVSKALLEWPAQTAEQPAPRGAEIASVRSRAAEIASARSQTYRDPLDAQASAPDDDSATFEARWEDRIEKPIR
jgi:hypothetical protein